MPREARPSLQPGSPAREESVYPPVSLPPWMVSLKMLSPVSGPCTHLGEGTDKFPRIPGLERAARCRAQGSKARRREARGWGGVGGRSRAGGRRSAPVCWEERRLDAQCLTQDP